MTLEKLRMYYKWYKRLANPVTLIFITISPSIWKLFFGMNIILFVIMMLIVATISFSRLRVIRWFENEVELLHLDGTYNYNIKQISDDLHIVECESGIDWRVYPDSAIKQGAHSILETGKVYRDDTGIGEDSNRFELTLELSTPKNSIVYFEFLIEIYYSFQSKELIVTKCSTTISNHNSISKQEDSFKKYQDVQSLWDASNLITSNPEVLEFKKASNYGFNFLTDAVFKLPRIVDSIESLSNSLTKIKII